MVTDQTEAERIGYARCSTLRHELSSQLDALSKRDIARKKVFSEQISTRVRVRLPRRVPSGYGPLKETAPWHAKIEIRTDVSPMCPRMASPRDLRGTQLAVHQTRAAYEQCAKSSPGRSAPVPG